MAKKKRKSSATPLSTSLITGAGVGLGMLVTKGQATKSRRIKGSIGLGSLFGGAHLLGASSNPREPIRKTNATVGTTMAAVIPASFVLSKLLPRATKEKIIRAARKSGPADARSTGYSYSNKFANFKKVATSLGKVVRRYKGVMGSDAETLAVASNTRVVDRVKDLVTRKLKNDEKVTEHLSRLQPTLVRGQAPYGQVLSGSPGKLTIDPTAHGIEMATSSRKSVDKLMKDFTNLITKADKLTRESGGKLTGFAHLPTSQVGDKVINRSLPRISVAGGHIHVDDHSRKLKYSMSDFLKLKDNHRQPKEVARAGGLASTLAHMTAPGSYGRASAGGKYGTKPIAEEYMEKLPGGNPTVELRSAPTTLSDPRLTKATLELTKLITEDPRSFEKAYKFMSKPENVSMTPLMLHKDPKAKSRVLNKLEDIVTSAGVTSDPGLNEVFSRAARNQTFADEGIDIGKSWGVRK